MIQDNQRSEVTVRGTVPVYLRIALFFLLVISNVLVAKYVVFSFSIAPGVSFFYTVVALMIVTTLWFGMSGAIADTPAVYRGRDPDVFPRM